MRLKYTPLFIASVCVIVSGFFYMFYKWDSSIGPLAGIFVMLLGIVCLGFYFILRIILRNLLWVQLLCEIVLILVISFSCYRLTRKIQLHVPNNFKGDIVLVYGVPSAPKLKPSSLFYRNIDVEVPPSGVIFIGNMFADKYLNNLLIIDKQNSRALEPGFGVGYAIDSLKCKNKAYKMEVLYYAYPPVSTNPPIDSLDKIAKKVLACKLLGY